MGAAFALVVVVDAPEDVRVERLGETRGMSADDARSRIRAQATTDARRAAADVWIDNVGSEDDVRARVRELWAQRLVPFEAALRSGRPPPGPTRSSTPTRRGPSRPAASPPASRSRGRGTSTGWSTSARRRCPTCPRPTSSTSSS